MLLQRILLVTVISLYADLIQKSAGQPTCESGDISNKDVGNCACRAFNVPAPPGQCGNRCQVGLSGPCPTRPSGVYLDDCMSDCTSDKNKDCLACGVWLHSLCLCLQNPTICTPSSKFGANFWVKLSRGNLATTNSPIPNILDLQRKHQALAEIGWEFGQKYSDPSSQALAINPARTISQDQIHMHICSIHNDMRKFLSALSPSSYSKLGDVQLDNTIFVRPGTQIPPNPITTMWCLASQTPNTPIKGDIVSGAINEVLGKTNVCDYNVAAAVMRDYNDYTWACVTADDGDTEHRFLSNC